MYESLEAWSDFTVAMTGATAALAGLIIVAMSVNIERIVKAPVGVSWVALVDILGDPAR